MVFIPDQELKQKMMKDGSVLKYMRTAGGAGIGLIAGSIVFFVTGALLALFLPPLGLLIAAPGILMLVPGVILRIRQLKNWKKDYMKKTGLTEQELANVEEEFMAPGTVMFAFNNSKKPGDLRTAGFVTEHYVRMPMAWINLFRLDEVVACFFVKGMGSSLGFDRALVLYDEKSAPGEGYIAKDSCDAKCGQEIVDAIVSRNPFIISAHRFIYEGRQYDALLGQPDVIALHNRLKQQR